MVADWVNLTGHKRGENPKQDIMSSTASVNGSELILLITSNVCINAGEDNTRILNTLLKCLLGSDYMQGQKEQITCWETVLSVTKT